MDKPLDNREKLVDAKSFHELLYDHQSQDFKKSRRNLMVIAFIIISISLMGHDIQDLQVFSLNLKNTSSKITIHWIGIALLAYWWFMFELYRNRDKKIRNRREILTHQEIEALDNELTDNEDDLQEHPEYYERLDNLQERNDKTNKIRAIKNALKYFKNLEKWNKPTLNLVLKVEFIELLIPRMISYSALLILLFQASSLYYLLR